MEDSPREQRAASGPGLTDDHEQDGRWSGADGKRQEPLHDICSARAKRIGSWRPSQLKSSHWKQSSSNAWTCSRPDSASPRRRSN